MTTLAESVSISYKSSAVAWAAAHTKEVIIHPLRDAETALRDSQPDGPERRLTARRATLWWNLMTAQGYAQKFFVSENSIRWRLEGLWVQLGNLVADLPDWDTYASADLKTVISFRNKAGLNETVITDAEAAFTGNSSEIPTTDFETQFEEMFDLFVNDIWAAEGMRDWTRDELNRGPESAADLAVWDDIQADAGQFFLDAKRCCVRLANNFAEYEAGGPNEASFINKYTKGPSNRYSAVGGLYALDPSVLPANYRGRVENKNVTYR